MFKNRNVINALYLTVQPLLLNAISIPATAYIIRRLGPTEYGQWATAVSIVGVLSFITSFGLRPQFIRAVAQDPDNASETLGHQLGLRVVLTVIAATMAFLACLCFRYEPTIRVCVLVTASGLLLNTITSTFVDLLQGLRYIRHYTTVSLISGVIVTAATIIAVSRNAGPIDLSIAYLTSPITNICLLYWILRKLRVSVRFRFDRSHALGLLKESRAWAASSFLNTLRDRIEQLMVPKLVGFEAMGFYTAGSMPADKLQIIPDGLSAAFHPAISGSSGNEQRHNIRQLINFSTIVCFASAILMNTLAEPLARILFPRSAQICEYVISVTSYALPFIGFGYPIGLALVATGEQSKAAKAGIFATLASVALSFVLMLYAGLHGACWSYVFRAVIPVIFLVPIFCRTFPALLSQIPLARMLIGGILMAFLLHFLDRFVNTFPIFSSGRAYALFAYIGCGALALAFYTVVLALLGVVDLRTMQFPLPKPVNLTRYRLDVWNWNK